MFVISPELDIRKREKYCSLCAAKHNENALFYTIDDEGSPIGCCQFEITKEGGKILTLRNAVGVNDVEPLIIAGRAALDFIERTSEGKTAIFEESDDNLATTLSFLKINGKFYLNLEGYFKKCIEK